MEYKLEERSDEQNEIIKEVKNGNNIIVDAVAGSGKTTTILYIGKEINNKNILLLTYNKRLKIETREKIKKLNINNIECHNYHSYGKKYYDNRCSTDLIIKSIIDNNIQINKHNKYDIIIIDETQDMTILYYEFLCKIIKDTNNKDCQIVILGDKKQCIFEFLDSDERFIKYAEKIFNFNDKKWSKKFLSMSFRLTDECKNFINKIILRKSRFKINHNNNKFKIRLLKSNAYSNTIINEIKYYIDKGYKYDDIFILCPSIKGNRSPCIILSYILSIENIPIYISLNDDTIINEEIIKNKIVFATFHQVKGLERKVIILYGFDNSYIKYYNKNINNKCPNIFYVALTRSSEQMTLIHDPKYDHMSFIDSQFINNFVETISYDQYFPNHTNTIYDDKKYYYIYDLTNHIPSSLFFKLHNLFSYEIIQEKSDILNIINIIKDKNNLYEDITDINSIAIPSYYEYKKTGQLKILKYIFNLLQNYKYDKTYLLEFYEQMKDKKLVIQDILKISNLYNCLLNGYMYKFKNILNYDWLDHDILNIIETRLDKYITNDSLYKIKIGTLYKDIDILGCIDCIDNNNIWLFKLTNEFKFEHLIHLSLYAYLHESEQKYNKNYYLFNILTNEIYKLNYVYNQLEQLIQLIIEFKNNNHSNKKDDVSFIDDINIIKKSYL